MAIKSIPAQDVLHKLLIYCPKTGVLFWRKRDNFRFSGMPAFDCKLPTGYKQGRLFGEQYYAHRIIYKLLYNDEPPQVDHINGDRSDNRVCNLRAATPGINAKNSSIGVRNKSGVLGVSFCESRKKWCAQIQVNGKAINLGRFSAFEDAVQARRSALEVYEFDKSHGKALN